MKTTTSGAVKRVTPSQSDGRVHCLSLVIDNLSSSACRPTPAFNYPGERTRDNHQPLSLRGILSFDFALALPTDHSSRVTRCPQSLFTIRPSQLITPCLSQRRLRSRQLYHGFRDHPTGNNILGRTWSRDATRTALAHILELPARLVPDHLPLGA